MRVLACVINWNTAEQLPLALASLAAQTHPDLDVVVVDNDSADDSLAAARRFRDVRVVANPANRGYAGAANQGLAMACALGAGALLLCNPDALLGPDYVARAVAALDADDRRAAVAGRLWRLTPGAAPAPEGARIIDTTGHLAFRTRLFRNRGEGQVDTGQYGTPGPVFGVSGALAVYRVAALDDIGCNGEVFDQDLFAYFEDVDVDWRLALRGWQVWYEPRAQAWHERGGAGPRRTAFVERLNFRNRLLMVLKNDDPAALARALPEVALTTALKTVELAATAPSALRAPAELARLVPRALARRRVVQARATVDPAEVVRRWFAPFDYPGWVRTWWGRVRP